MDGKEDQSHSTLSGDRQNSFIIPEYVLDDLCSRFIINLPDEERKYLIRIFFQIELAHWFYLDFYCNEQPELKTIGIKSFSAQIFKHCPFLQDHSDNYEEILKDWKTYKLAVPTYGAILLDPTLTHCLLVQGFWNKSSWGFPKGKVNEEEPAVTCAIREVREETGFDISSLITEDVYIEHTVCDQMARLYIIPGVAMDTEFVPRTRGEIKYVQWFCVDHLPSNKKDTACKTHLNLSPNSFFMVMPFVKRLRSWIAKKQGRDSMSRRTPKGSRDRESTAHVSATPPGGHTDKQQQQRLFEQQRFAQQNWTQLEDLFSHSTSPRTTTGDQKGKLQSDAAPRFQKLRSQQTPGSGKRSESTPSPKNAYKILNRDGSLSGNSKSRRSLATQFSVSPVEHDGPTSYNKNQHQRKADQSEFSSQAWLHFKFDVDKIMSCLS